MKAYTKPAALFLIAIAVFAVLVTVILPSHPARTPDTNTEIFLLAFWMAVIFADGAAIIGGIIWLLVVFRRENSN